MGSMVHDRSMLEALKVLVERRNWLRERIKAKQAVAWDTEYDERECAALTHVLEQHGYP